MAHGTTPRSALGRRANRRLPSCSPALPVPEMCSIACITRCLNCVSRMRGGIKGFWGTRLLERGSPPISCMSCLSHRCSVSLSNKNSLSLSLSVGFFGVFSSVWFLWWFLRVRGSLWACSRTNLQQKGEEAFYSPMASSEVRSYGAIAASGPVPTARRAVWARRAAAVVSLTCLLG